jgi:hypothetical protein
MAYLHYIPAAMLLVAAILQWGLNLQARLHGELEALLAPKRSRRANAYMAGAAAAMIAHWYPVLACVAVFPAAYSLYKSIRIVRADVMFRRAWRAKHGK